MKGVCKLCGKIYEKRALNQKYCCEKHRNTAQRRRDRSKWSEEKWEEHRIKNRERMRKYRSGMKQ